MLVSLALLLTLGGNVLRTETASVESTSTDLAASSSAPGQWQPWSAERARAAVASDHPVFVDFTAAWCITCQYNKQNALSNPEVLQDFADKRVTLMRADWTQRDPSITQALSELGRNGVPVYVLYKQGRPPVVFSEILSIQDMRLAIKAL
jgi:thiol:disulfide interchange protein DsbD